ncbi:MAG: 16S rRNA (cytosine(967)-C(5))-methyltransferase RsmB [Blastocatellia bacterium]
MNVSPARLAAYEVLWRVQTEDAYASNLLASSRYDTLAPADHALAQELTLGVLRWQLQLDWLIAHFTRRKLAKLDVEVVIALRLGLYQLLFLTRIPPHAALNESVNLVKLHRKFSAAPLVNGVLRAVQRSGKEETKKLFVTIPAPLERLSIEVSHPQWLLEKWTQRFGINEARALALTNNQAPQTAFRFNSHIQSEAATREWFAAHNIQLRASSLAPNAAVITHGSLSAQSDPIQKGWIYLQDEASQLVAHLAADHQPPTTGHRLLDLCAAPGSKTSLLASLLPASSLLVAADLHAHRLQTMRELTARARIDDIYFVQLDATQPLPFAGQFDAVLLDAPCSGLGTLQRHPEIKWRATSAKLHELAALQTKLLANAAAVVPPGGLLVYSVCSTEPEEGEAIVAPLLGAGWAEVTAERLARFGSAGEAVSHSSPGVRTFTHTHHTESFFMCVLRRL